MGSEWPANTALLGDRTGGDGGGGDARVGAGEAVGEEEWAPGQSCSMLGNRMGLGFSCFPLIRCDFFCFSLPVVGGPITTGKAGLVPCLVCNLLYLTCYTEA